MYSYALPNVADAFNKYVDTDIPNTTKSIKLIPDYTINKNDWDKYQSVRALTTLINWKSNVNNADMTYNFRVKLTQDLKRGDMVYDSETGLVGLISWNVDRVVDCKKTQVTTCNASISVYRHIPEEINVETGMVTTEAYESKIVDAMPCVYAEMYGRNEYEKASSSPGIIPEQPIDLRIQLNLDTKNIKIGDYFYIHDVPYFITMINKSQYTIDGTSGIIALICERSERT